MAGNQAQLLVFHPLLEGYHVFGHVPHFLYRTTTFNVERVENVLSFGADGVLIGDVVGDGPHLFPVKLLRVEPHTMIEVGLVDVEVHHAWVWTPNLGNVRVAEAAAYLGGTAPVLNLCLHVWVAAFNHTRDHGVALAGTLQVCNHLTYSTAGIKLAEPGWDVGVGVVWSLLFLNVHQHHRNIQVANGWKHVVGGGVGKQLKNHQIHVGGTEFITGSLRLLFGGHQPTVNQLHAVGKGLLKGCILRFKLRNQRWELRKVGTKGDGEHTHAGLRFN